MCISISDLELSPRRQRILQAVVEKHIQTAMPVSSEIVAREYMLGISSATVRIEFAALENMGLVKQPHTSAGRIPSDKGYRVYVDKILMPKPLKRGELVKVRSTLRVQCGTVEELLKAACNLLSSLTGYAALTCFVSPQDRVIRDLRISAVNSRKLFIVIILNNGSTLHRLFYFANPTDLRKWNVILPLLKSAVCNVPMKQILRMRIPSVLQHIPLPRPQIDDLTLKLLATGLEMIQQMLQLHETTVFMSGLNHLLSQPEFSEAKKAQELVEILNDPPRHLLMPSEFMNQPSPWTMIGIELLGGVARQSFEVLSECSIVSAPYFIGDILGGTVSVLGPKRMQYGRAMSAVSEVSKWLSSSLTSLLS